MPEALECLPNTLYPSLKDTLMKNPYPKKKKKGKKKKKKKKGKK